MGAEQSALGKGGSSSPTNVRECLKESWQGEEWFKELPEEMKEYLRGKREAFKQVENERDELRKELTINEMSYQSIIDGYISRLITLEQSNDQQLANLISLEAISQGLVEFQTSPATTSSSDSKLETNEKK